MCLLVASSWLATAARGTAQQDSDLLRSFETAIRSWKQAAKDAMLARQQYVICEEYEAAKILDNWNQAIKVGREQFDTAVRLSLEIVEQAPEQITPDVAALLGAAIATNYESGNYETVAEYCDQVLAQAPDAPYTVLSNRLLAAFGLNDFAKCRELLASYKQRGVPLTEQMQAIDANLETLAAAWDHEQSLRAAEAQRDDLPRVRLICDVEGNNEVVLELFEDQAPNTVANFIALVKQNYYDNMPFHQVITHISAQGGARSGDSLEEPAYVIKGEAESPDARHAFRGALAMSSVHDQNYHGTQFYVVLSPSTNNAVNATVFGRVLSGMDVINKLNITHTTNTERQRFDPVDGVTPSKIVKAEVVRDRGHDYQPTKLRNPAAR